MDIDDIGQLVNVLKIQLLLRSCIFAIKLEPSMCISLSIIVMLTQWHIAKGIAKASKYSRLCYDQQGKIKINRIC
jgi:hypothetical protein